MSAVDLQYVNLSGQLSDISSATEYFMYVTEDLEGELVEVSGVLGGAITTGDATITIARSGNSIGTITVANASSAEGDVDSLFPTDADRFLTKGDYLKISSDGGSTNAVVWGFMLRIKR